MDWSSVMAERTRHDHRNLVSGSSSSIIQMAGGFPEPELFPADDWLKATSAVLQSRGADALQYNNPAGHEPLRDWISRRVSGSTAINADHILLTHGAQQGIDLVAKLLIDPGDRIIVEQPSFHGALWVFQAAGATIVPVPIEKQGIDLNVLEERLRESEKLRMLPKFIYTIPTFHNPTGYTATLERRIALLELAERYGVPVIEDVPYNELWYDAPPPPTLFELSNGDSVIQLGTFSKTLCPSIRVGWIVGAKEFIRKAVHFKHIADTCSNQLMQLISYEWCVSGLLDQNIGKARDIYRIKRDALSKTFLNAQIPGIECTAPGGGFFAWLRLPKGISGTVIQEAALRHGVAIAASPMFDAEGKADDACRLTFSYPSEIDITRGVAQLTEAIESYIHNNKEGIHNER